MFFTHGYRLNLKPRLYNAGLGKLEPHFLNVIINKIKKIKINKKRERRRKKYEGSIAACIKHGNNSTPKNASIAQENTALDAFYGHMFKTRLLLFSLSCIFLKMWL